MADWECVDQRVLRNIIPDNRLRVYEVHTEVQMMAQQNQGLSGALGSFGSSLLRGSLGLPPAPQFNQYGQYPQQQGMYGQTPQMQ